MILVFALALQTPPAGGSLPKDIVITGRRPEVTGRILAGCIARHCSPAEEIEASLDHADTQFLAGDYAGARQTMLKARSRNRKYAGVLPTEVGDLLRAHGRIASVNGHPDEAKLGQIESVEALKAGLGPNDGRVFAQRLEIGNAYLRMGEIRMADEVFKRVIRQARDADLAMLQGAAMLRRAVMYGVLASADRAYSSAARHVIRELQATTDPRLQPYRDGMRLLEAQLAGVDGKVEMVDRIAAEMAARPVDRPVLLYQRALNLNWAPRRPDRPPETTNDGAPHWADIAFRIGADGKVHDVDVTRQAPDKGLWWVEAVKANIMTRRYAPLSVPSGSNGMQRIERYSMVHDLSLQTGSRMIVRSAKGSLEMLDITSEPPPG